MNDLCNVLQCTLDNIKRHHDLYHTSSAKPPLKLFFYFLQCPDTVHVSALPGVFYLMTVPKFLRMQFKHVWY